MLYAFKRVHSDLDLFSLNNTYQLSIKNIKRIQIAFIISMAFLLFPLDLTVLQTSSSVAYRI